MQHVKYPSTPRFADVVVTMKESNLNAIWVRPKIKLHGANVGIVRSGGQTYLQSRRLILGPDRDMMNVVSELKLPDIDCDKPYVIYGEWAGPECAQVTDTPDAVALIPQRTFFVFSIATFCGSGDQFVTDSIGDPSAEARFVVEPEDIRIFLSQIYSSVPDNVRVLPWAGEAVEMRSYDPEHNKAVFQGMQKAVSAIAEEDPYIKSEFGVVSHGEGLVYMQTAPKVPAKRLPLFFKMKTHHHDVLQRTYVRHEVVIPEDVKAFAEAFITENRIRQMADENTGGEISFKVMRKLIPAVIRDVLKEGRNEIDAGGLDISTLGKTAPDLIKRIVQDITSKQAA